VDIAIQIALNAVVAGAIYSLAALGFNLLFSTTRFFDLAFGGYAAASAYAMYWLYKEIEAPFFIAIAIAIFVGALLGFIVEKAIYRPLRARRASPIVYVVASLGVLSVIQSVLAMLFSSQFQTLSKSLGNAQIFDIGGGTITQTQVFILCAALAIMTILGLVMRYTLFGKAVRAISDDEEVTQIVGIHSERIIGYVFLIGSGIGGLAGISMGFDTGIQPTMGMAILLSGVVAAIVGGVGNVYGGVAGAFLLAIVENASVWFLSGEWKSAIAFAILILFLLFRPRGLFQQ
jgi:branched-chain amino acid transport system permease protein